YEVSLELVPFFAAIESNLGFMFTDLAGERLRRAATDVWRITHDQIEADGGEGLKKVGLKKTNTVCETETSGVAASYIESGGGDVRGIDGGVGKFLGQGDGDAAGAGADIHEGDAVSGKTRRAAGVECTEGEAIERNLDEMFGFGAWNQNVRRNFEFEAPELLLTGEVLRGLTVRAALNEREKTAGGFGGENFFRMRIEPGAITGGDIKE